MIRKIYRELVRIRKELHAIRSNIEFFSKLPTMDDELRHKTSEQSLEVFASGAPVAASAKRNAEKSLMQG